MPRLTVPPLRVLGRREPWLAALLYLLFACASFSIAGMDAAVLLLYVLLLVSWRWESAWSELPRWLTASFFLVPAIALVCALANGIEAAPAGGALRPTYLESLLHLRHLYRMLLPLLLLPALARVRLRGPLLTLLASSVLMSAYALVQFEWGVDWYRPVGHKVITPYGNAFAAAGTFSHHLTFGGVMMMQVLLFGGLAALDKRRVRWLWGVGAVACALAVVASLARSDWLGLVVGLALVLSGFPRRLVRPFLVAGVLLAVLGGMVGSGWLARRVGNSHEPALARRLVTSSIQDNRERLHLWESALMGIRDRPWLGVGYYNYPPYAVAYRTEMIKREGVVFHIALNAQMHNVFLEVAFALGLPGLVAFLVWWFALFVWNRRSLVLAGDGFGLERGILYGASAALAALLVAGMFENNFFDAEVQTLTMILIALCLHVGLTIRRGAAKASPAGPGGEPLTDAAAPPVTGS